jgi:hypothetical protein
MGWELVLLSSLAPVAMDLIKNVGQGLGRRFGGLSVEDQIRIGQSDVERLHALAALDSPVGTPSQWIVDLRAAFRYVAALLLIVFGLGLTGYGASDVNTDVMSNGLAIAAAPFSFIFGERLFLPMIGKAK